MYENWINGHKLKNKTILKLDEYGDTNRKKEVFVKGLFEQNYNLLGLKKILCREVILGDKSKIDYIALDKENNPVIVEIKATAKSDGIFEQCIHYYEQFKKIKPKRWELYINKQNINFEQAKPYIICLGYDFGNRVMSCNQFVNKNIAGYKGKFFVLYQYKITSDNQIAFREISSGIRKINYKQHSALDGVTALKIAEEMQAQKAEGQKAETIADEYGIHYHHALKILGLLKLTKDFKKLVAENKINWSDAADRFPQFEPEIQNQLAQKIKKYIEEYDLKKITRAQSKTIIKNFFENI